MIARLCLFAAVLLSVTPSLAFEVLTWNVESGGSSPATIARELGELPPADIYLLQEVSPRDIGRYAAAIRNAHPDSFKHYLSSFGGGDRLAIIVNESKYEIRSFSELVSHGSYRLNDYRHRSPLVTLLERKSDGQRLLVVNVHLARGNAKLRTEQAAGLREWAKEQSLPVVLAGDCNFDFQFATRAGNQAYEEFLAGDTWRLIEPKVWVDTNWSDKDGDGEDDYPNSCLDFGAYCPNGHTIGGMATVVVRDGDFPDTDATSDHRPVRITVQTGPSR